jgi:hypothetical protein
VLFVPALLLMPMERQIQAQRDRLKYGGARVTLDMRDAIGQGMAIALLAGFRGVVADFLWIQANGFWEKRQWLRQYRDMVLVTTLQPQSVLFWDTTAWHMAWNIGYAVSVDPANRTRAEGIKRQREWQEKAREFLERGIENIPNRYELYFALGWLYYEKLSGSCEDPPCARAFCKAAEYFGRASQFKEAPRYIRRMYARALEKCGDPVDAYAVWKEMWDDKTAPGDELRIVERELKTIENTLHIPDEQRVFPTGRAPTP